MARQALALAGFIGGCMAAGAIGAVATARGLKGWYPALRKPAFTPPNQVFGPVWTTLYVLIGASGYRLWQKRQAPEAREALRWWGLQMAANAAWSPIFFGLQKPGPALADLGLMWGAIAMQARTAWQVDKPAALMTVPYLGWVTFAGALNEEVWRLNR